MFGFIIGFLGGLVLGVGIAIYILASWLESSNDFGNSRGTLKDFSGMSVNIVEQRNDLKKRKFEKEFGIKL